MIWGHMVFVLSVSLSVCEWSKFHSYMYQNIFTLYVVEFVDKKDNSLGFAAYGAPKNMSFPLAVVNVSPAGCPLEFLLCFHGNDIIIMCFRNVSLSNTSRFIIKLPL